MPGPGPNYYERMIPPGISTYYDRWTELADAQWADTEDTEDTEQVTRYAITDAVGAVCDYVAEDGVGYEALEHLQAAEEYLRATWPESASRQQVGPG